MPPPEPTPTTLLHAYRHLLRAALRAVQFSKPARYVVRDQIREGFEQPPRTTTTAKIPSASYDAERVRRTVWFLKAAAQEAGLESRILKSLVRVAWERKEGRGPKMTWKGTLAVAKGREGGRGKRLVSFFSGLLGCWGGGVVWGWFANSSGGRVQTPSVVVKTAYSHYDLTVKMLNDTMGLCLR